MITKRELEGIRSNVASGVRRLQLKSMFEPKFKREIEEIIEKDLKPALTNLDYLISTI